MRWNAYESLHFLFAISNIFCIFAKNFIHMKVLFIKSLGMIFGLVIVIVFWYLIFRLIWALIKKLEK